MPAKKPTKRTVRTETFDDAEEERPPQVPWSDEPEDGSESQVQSILESLGPGDVKIKISKWGAKGAAYCFSTDGDIDEDFIQSQFGGGRYTGKIFVNGVYRHSFQLNIAERVSAASNGGMADPNLRFMQQQIDILKESLLRNQQQTPVSEMAQAIQVLSQINGGGSAGLGEKAVELLLKGFELGKTISGGDKGDSWTEVIREALPVVGEMMKGRQMMNGGAAADPGAREVKTLQAADSSDVIRQGITYLKQKALRNGDPGLYIEWILDNADEAQYQPILHFILTSEFSAFMALDPEIGQPPYVAFFRSMYDGLRSAYAESNSVAVDSLGAGGDGGDLAGNGGAGKAGGGKSGTKKAG